VSSLWRESSDGTAWYSNRPVEGSPERRGCVSALDWIRLVSSPVLDKTTIKAWRWSSQSPASAFKPPPFFVPFVFFIKLMVNAGSSSAYGVKPYCGYRDKDSFLGSNVESDASCFRRCSCSMLPLHCGAGRCCRLAPSRCKTTASTRGTYICVSAGRCPAISS